MPIDVDNSNHFKQSDHNQADGAGERVEHLEPVLARSCGEDQAHEEAERADASWKKRIIINNNKKFICMFPNNTRLCTTSKTMVTAKVLTVAQLKTYNALLQIQNAMMLHAKSAKQVIIY